MWLYAWADALPDARPPSPPGRGQEAVWPPRGLPPFRRIGSSRFPAVTGGRQPRVDHGEGTWRLVGRPCLAVSCHHGYRLCDGTRDAVAARGGRRPRLGRLVAGPDDAPEVHVVAVGVPPRRELLRDSLPFRRGRFARVTEERAACFAFGLGHSSAYVPVEQPLQATRGLSPQLAIVDLSDHRGYRVVAARRDQRVDDAWACRRGGRARSHPCGPREPTGRGRCLRALSAGPASRLTSSPGVTAPWSRSPAVPVEP